MQKLTIRVLLLVLTVSFFYPSFSQLTTNTGVLKQAAIVQAEKEKKLYQQLQKLAVQKGWEMVMKKSNGGIAILTGIDEAGNPLYTGTDNNIIAAATIGTSSLWPGGALGLSLNGGSINVKDKLAVWDGGKVRNTHVELNGRVLQKDGATTLSDHATHTSGTMIAAGINPLAKGMSFGQQELIAYDFNNHLSEMLNESPNILLSNHSYGTIAGWTFNETQNRWEFYGQSTANEDYKLGYYSSETQVFDSIAYNAPYYLIVKSAGNKRTENGPAVGSPYWRYDASNVMSNAGNRPAGISNNDSYDIIPTYGTAKNILTVGAVNPIPSGYSKSSDVALASFSSWGPTDDGRIKPDVVADGVNLLSSIATSDNAYAVFSGTSMSSPGTAGSLLLLQEYYSQQHAGNFMRSATLKALVIQTADEAGLSPGPDYQFGWGLVNMRKAAAVLAPGTSNHIVSELLLNNNDITSYSLPVVASGNGKISATICWTDPKADVEPVATALNNPAKKLVNDLDLVIKKGTTTYRSWLLNPAVPSADATTGDNTTDNVEKVELPDVIPGETYTIEVTRKGTLARGVQAFSLVASGVGGQAFCASAPSGTAGAKIDSVSFANIQNKNAPACTGYSNFTNLTGVLQPAQTVPLFVRLSSCDASVADKIVKVYMDANNDGDFADAGEDIATSNIINGNGDFSTNITVPAGLTPGRYTIMRIVMQETNVAGNVTSCGTYTKGETQDYRILIATPSNDVGISELISPISGSCSSGTQLVVVRIRNFGSTLRSNVAVSAIVKQGTTTVATLNGVYPGNIDAGSDVAYTFQTPFAAAGNTSYTITSSTILIGDQDPGNNQNVTTVNTSPNSSDPAGTANICSNNAILNVNPASADVYSWYNSNTTSSPFAVGANITTSNILPTYYLGKNDNSFTIGPANKDVFPSGNYNRFSGNFVQFNNSVPVVIESARLYIGYTSVSNKLQFILGSNFTFNSSNGSYTYMPEASTTLDIYPTDPTPLPGLQPNDLTDQGAVFYFNLPVTTTGDHILIISQNAADDAALYRNNNITSAPYPVGIPGIFTFTGNSATYSNPPSDFQNFYYFFYNMKLQLAGCPAGNRVAIVPTTATPPVISLNGNVLTSTTAANYQWYLNGAAIPGAIDQNYTATANGNYTVQSTVSGCTVTSNQINVTTTPVSNVDPAEIGLIVSPNPAPNGEFSIQLETTTRDNLFISMVNTVGQKVYQNNIPNFIGRLSLPVKPGKLSAGVYYLQVQHDKKMYVKKIVVAR